ncbi:hypothetical protein O181_028587 [Austropuccinia psidii MF-1]|uniref:Uncharacterized protein n=1 Tax=Austropuccinia psidii MF-1 TaxID=1389203 RepID=A0A9Q3CS72_9BASI|nr:hypothetical protein [Austropuccinia psidii MF-1]
MYRAQPQTAKYCTYSINSFLSGLGLSGTKSDTKDIHVTVVYLLQTVHSHHPRRWHPTQVAGLSPTVICNRSTPSPAYWPKDGPRMPYDSAPIH